MITCSCPQCAEQFEAEEEWIGQQAECPVCNSTITIQAPQNQPEQPVQQPIPMQKKSGKKVILLLGVGILIACVAIIAVVALTNKKSSPKQVTNTISPAIAQAQKDAKEKGIKFSSDWTVLQEYPYALEATEYVIPSCVTTIGEKAFWECKYLAKITIPNSVTSIEKRAFEDCRAILSITIPGSVSRIGERAFNGCTGLRNVTISEGVTSIEHWAFGACEKLTNVTIPNSVTIIEGRALPYSQLHLLPDNKNFRVVDGVLFSYDQSKIFQYPRGKQETSYTIPDGVSSIENWAFGENKNLISITMPNTITSIGEYAFAYCPNLTSATISSNVTNIGDGAFTDCGKLTNIIIPNGVTNIGKFAFSDCKNLTNITIPDSVTSIGKMAFDGCPMESDVKAKFGNLYQSK